ncbi:InlB B-repeat-containing protein [Clostridiaceae bacterium Marseille-Q4143]|nr:InlB B-repeat-containing protein [Clostridiaceae bacterium Marseille-Q4143]
MKRKVKALLALALTLALVCTTLGDNWLYVSAENAAEAEEQTDEPAAAAEEETEEKPAAPEEAALEETVSEETIPVEETAAVEEETAPVELVPEEKQTEEQKPEAAEASAEQPTGAPTETPAPAHEQKQEAESPAPADDQKQEAETPVTAAAAPAETPAADAAEPAAPAETPATDAEVPGADEKDTEIVEEETGLTEQTIEASVDTEEKDVVITLTGEMPEEATASACPVDISMDGVNIISAYDITIYDADGQEFQPSDEKPLQVKIEDDAVRKALEENTELEVYHLEDAEAEPEQVQEVNLEAAAVEFQAPSFSIYAVVTPEQHFTHTYQFVDENGTTLLSEQILSAGEVLNEPESPAKAHKKFIGWFDEKNNLFNSFDEEGTLSVSITTVLKAKYETVYYVFYKAGNSTDSKILYTQTYHNANDSIVADGVPFAVPSEKALIGWSVNPEAETPDKDLMLKGEDVTLYPVVADAHWITYDTQGGTILDPTYVLANDTTVAPATNPTKIGYEFAGWFTDAACTAGSMFEFGSSLVRDIKLYAKWNPGTANYTVIHWWENADDNEYSYHRSETKSGTTGEYTQAAGTDPLDTRVTGKNLLGKEVIENVFTAKKIDQQVIKGDGSTIVNVYYTRKQYTLSFRRGSSEGTVLKTLSKKYGAQISSNEWPKFVYESTGSLHNKKDNSHIAQPNEENAFGNWKIASGKYLAYSSTMPLGDGNLWTYDTGSRRSSAQYCLQNLNDNNYTIDHTDYAGSSAKIGLEDAYEITGFTFEKVGIQELDWSSLHYKENFYKGDKIKGKPYDGAKFYYTRNKYNIVYHNGNQEDSKIECSFGADITNSGSYQPKTRPAGVESDYTFAGWYQDPEGTTPYIFAGKTMPANDIIVYAKWAAPTYTVTFDLNGAISEDKYSDQTVEKGKLATEPADPIREGYTFAGWTKNGSPFSFQTQITEDTTLTAQWISNEKYPLTYVSNNGKNVRQADGESYAVGAEAKVINVPEGTGWEAPDGMEKFLCWNTEANGNGTDYYPGDSFRMPENVTEEGTFLYAKWVPKRETTLNYDLNYEVAGGERLYGQTTITIPNKPYSIGSNSDDPAKNDPFREGYKFLGWSTQKIPAENDKLLKKGEQIQVDTIQENTDNVLYAQWQKLKEVSLNITKIVRGGFGNVNESFNFEYTIAGTGVTEKTETFTLTSGKSKLLENIPEGATVTVTEKAANGYTTSYKIGTGAETAGSSCSYTVTGQEEDRAQIEVTFFNQKDEVAPTGVTTDWLSSILMLFAGLGMAVVMLLTGKRRKI